MTGQADPRLRVLREWSAYLEQLVERMVPFTETRAEQLMGIAAEAEAAPGLDPVLVANARHDAVKVSALVAEAKAAVGQTLPGGTRVHEFPVRS